jgi:hypothetical protein
MVSTRVTQNSELVQSEWRVTCRRTVAVLVGAAVSLMTAATSAEAQAVADSAAPLAAAAQEQTASTQQNPNPWRDVKFGGLGTYARYQVTSANALGVRYERLDDEGLFGGIDQVLHGATVTGEYKLADGFLVRAEYRRDWSNERLFPGRLGASDLRGHQNTALIGGVWWFGNKQGSW